MPSIYHLLSRQIPAHVQQAYPVFCKFIEYYYRWLQTRGFVSLADIQNIDSETNSITIKDSTTDPENYLHHTISNGSAVAEVVGIQDDRLIVRYLTDDAKFELDDRIHIRGNSNDQYTDEQFNKLDRAVISQVETLPSAFIDHFSNMLDSDHIFGTHTPNIATILRNVRSLYKAKGSDRAMKYLIKATKNIDVDIKYPWDNVLRLSDGKWNQQYCVTVASDPRYWHYLPLQIDHLRFMSTAVDNYGQQKFKDFAITKIEVFATQSENYDQGALIDINSRPFVFDALNGQQLDEGYWTNSKIVNIDDSVFDDYGPYWNRDENPRPDGVNYMPYKKDPVTGSILFDPPKDATYGRFGDRYVHAYIRFYVEGNPRSYIGQEVRVIEENKEGKQYVSYVGNVTNGITGVEIVSPGYQWQEGQIFTASKDQIWQVYSSKTNDDKYISFINNKGVSIEYSVDKPLIGRVLSVGDQGSIKTVEILQFGDHVPEGADKVITIAPIGDCDRNPQYNAQIKLKYQATSHNTGFFEDFSGMLSCNDIRIQDSNYYQQYSYDIIANVDGNEFKDIANLLHPAGTKMFTAYIVDADLDAQIGFDIDVHSPWQHVSLVDIALATEKLTKQFIKDLHEYSNVEEFISKQTNKKLHEGTGIFDGDGENNIIYSLDLNYDNPKNELQWVERTVDDKTFKKTSYVDSGFIRSLHINYDYHYVPIAPTNPFPDVTSGGFVKLTPCDGIDIIRRSFDRFYNEGEIVTIEFEFNDPEKYRFDGVTATNETSHDAVDVKAENVESQRFVITFKMPNDNVNIVINGTTLRWPIVANYCDHGTITPNKIVAFKGENININTIADPKYTLGSLYYYTKILGTVYITNTKSFVMPAEDVIVGATFISDGGKIKLSCPTSLDISVWANGQQVGPNDFIKQGTEIRLKVGSTDVYTFNGASFIGNEQFEISIDRDNPVFSMPNYDIIINVHSQIRTTPVFSQVIKTGMHARGTMKVIPEGELPIGSEFKVIADPGIRSELDELYYTEKLSDGSIKKHILARDSLSQKVFTLNVGKHQTHVCAVFKPTGGYVNNDIEYENNAYTQPKIGTWIPMNSDVVVNAEPVDGMEFVSMKYCDEETYPYEAEWETITVLPHTFKMEQLDVYLREVKYRLLQYHVSAIQQEGGTITLSQQGRIDFGTTIKVAVNPADRYRLKQLSYTNSKGTFDITKTKSFSVPSADTTINVLWDKYVYDLNNVKSNGGALLLAVNGVPLKNGINRVEKGSLVTIGTQADSGYRVKSISYNAGEGNIDITNEKTFVMPSSDVSFNVVWELATYKVTINPPQLLGNTTTVDGSDQAYKTCYINVTYDSQTINGNTSSGAPVIINVPANKDITITLVTEKVSNPQYGGITKMIVADTKAINVNTSQNIVQYQTKDGLIERTYIIMPMSDVNINMHVSPKYERQ